MFQSNSYINCLQHFEDLLFYCKQYPCRKQLELTNSAKSKTKTSKGILEPNIGSELITSTPNAAVKTVTPEYEHMIVAGADKVNQCSGKPDTLKDVKHSPRKRYNERSFNINSEHCILGVNAESETGKAQDENQHLFGGIGNHITLIDPNHSLDKESSEGASRYNEYKHNGFYSEYCKSCCQCCRCLGESRPDRYKGKPMTMQAMCAPSTDGLPPSSPRTITPLKTYKETEPCSSTSKTSKKSTRANIFVKKSPKSKTCGECNLSDPVKRKYCRSNLVYQCRDVSPVIHVLESTPNLHTRSPVEFASTIMFLFFMMMAIFFVGLSIGEHVSYKMGLHGIKYFFIPSYILRAFTIGFVLMKEFLAFLLCPNSIVGYVDLSVRTFTFSLLANIIWNMVEFLMESHHLDPMYFYLASIVLCVLSVYVFFKFIDNNT